MVAWLAWPTSGVASTIRTKNAATGHGRFESPPTCLRKYAAEYVGGCLGCLREELTHGDPKLCIDDAKR